jgi:hypothetical protein
MDNPFSMNKAERAISLGIHFLLYAIIFLGGYIFAKIQTLLMGI